jgi:hypothetical protein
MTNGHSPEGQRAEDFSLRPSEGPGDTGGESIRVTPPSWPQAAGGEPERSFEPAAATPDPVPAIAQPSEAPASESAPAAEIPAEPAAAPPPRETHPAIVWSSSATVGSNSPFRSDRDE